MRLHPSIVPAVGIATIVALCGIPGGSAAVSAAGYQNYRAYLGQPAEARSPREDRSRLREESRLMRSLGCRKAPDGCAFYLIDPDGPYIADNLMLDCPILIRTPRIRYSDAFDLEQ